ncbi:angiopoietin-4-like [Anopheles maculipalpis]|uniref:angiopoietin-4-like n=1 Tax=Anopheles maculipalpis TaxID=1496333 RepID=UPI002158DC50|nr:angiopoietin-4-like [Anopheles maculipalpis]
MKWIVLVFAVSCTVRLGYAKIDAIALKFGLKPAGHPNYWLPQGYSDIEKCGCHEIDAKLRKVESNLLKLILNLRNKYGTMNSKLIDMKKHVTSVSWYLGQTSDTSEDINTQLFDSSITVANIMQSIRDLTIHQQRLLTKTFLTESIRALEKRLEGKKPQQPEGDIIYTSCDDERITQTGTYLVQDAFAEPTKVICVLDYGPDAYTVIQNRLDGSIDFYRGYSDYRSGFGEYDGGDYWLGLDRIHNITTSGDYELLILLEDFEKNVATARYDNFEIGSGNDFYPIIKLDGYSGTAGDSWSAQFSARLGLGSVVGALFSAYDQDQDKSDTNCAVSNRGGWWYTDCGQSNLNGLYLKGVSGDTTGMYWETFRGPNYSLKTSRMMVKRKQMPTTTETTTTSTTVTTETTVTTTELVTEATPTTTTSTSLGPETTVTTTEMGTDPTPTTTTSTSLGPETTVTTTETDSTPTTTSLGPETTVTTTEIGTDPTPTTATSTSLSPETTVTTTEIGTDPTPTTTSLGPETTTTIDPVYPETIVITTVNPETPPLTTIAPETPAMTTTTVVNHTTKVPIVETSPVTAEVTESTIAITTNAVETTTMLDEA